VDLVVVDLKSSAVAVAGILLFLFRKELLCLSLSIMLNERFNETHLGFLLKKKSFFLYSGMMIIIVKKKKRKESIVRKIVQVLVGIA
jgi:hypothetical protein